MFALDYHESTKHAFNRFARSSGYLDWASQPDPFRVYSGAPLVPLPRAALPTSRSFPSLYAAGATAMPFDHAGLGEFLRCAMGLSAWKQYQASRWALRVNPSSGNLHPTECYVVWDGRVCHYAPRDHVLEQRVAVEPAAWQRFTGGSAGFLVALSSIFWREAWKYGERAFRYCQHDVGHAIGALRYSAALRGWQLTLLPQWPDAQIAALLGLDRDDDYAGAEREEAECLAWVAPADVPAPALAADPAGFVASVRLSPSTGRANRLSSGHVDWDIIDRVGAATRYAGGPPPWRADAQDVRAARGAAGLGELEPPAGGTRPHADVSARDIILQRRSAIAFDPRSTLPRDTFFAMLARLQPSAPPWDAIDWPPQVHLALFVHRVDGLVPGIYAYLRDPAVLDEWKAAMRPEFLWEPIPSALSTPLPPSPPNRPNRPNDPNAPNVPNVPNVPHDAKALFLLLPLDVTWAAKRVSCDQDIAGDGFFSLAMIAPLESSLRQHGEWFYRRLFWECGLIGQVLYLEAEAAGARSTGIGCFYDDAVHETLGLSGNAWQSLYHFSMGMPVDDSRLTTQPGYEEGF